ncbi:hypothetical protein J2Y69_001656 [Microbacterium resistens]|uniref:Uncharacterized protein n=1 Tax=Microbacterium resistens TaxID=156977 RepID=A0ABU1SBS1_9MICO|nr:hypothetical protein [Microbacterium resistens]
MSPITGTTGAHLHDQIDDLVVQTYRGRASVRVEAEETVR